jgi:hypothetical protein
LSRHIYQETGDQEKINKKILQQVQHLLKACVSLNRKKQKTIKISVMKKTILTIGMMLTVALTTAFANDGTTNSSKAQTSFGNNFKSASNVSWQQDGSFSKATFSMNNQVMFAYYNVDGDLMAVVRNILSEQLPINLQTELKKKYSDRWISDLFEMANEGQTTYYVTLESADETITLQSTDFNSWSVFKKAKKA